MNTKNIQDENDRRWLGDSEAPDFVDHLTGSLDRIYSSGPSPEEIQLAISKLDQELDSHFGPRVYYDEIPESPIGRIFVAVTELGVIRIEFDLTEEEFKEQVQKRGFRRFIRSAQETASTRRQVSDYLDGTRDEFDIQTDLTGVTRFQHEVLVATSSIPRGQVKTYGEIAHALGRPKSSRAVGRALGSNPIPLVIPCHRVIGSDGSLRGYSGGGGIRSKAFLLQLEGAQITGV